MQDIQQTPVKMQRSSKKVRKNATTTTNKKSLQNQNNNNSTLSTQKKVQRKLNFDDSDSSLSQSQTPSTKSSFEQKMQNFTQLMETQKQVFDQNTTTKQKYKLQKKELSESQKQFNKSIKEQKNQLQKDRYQPFSNIKLYPFQIQLVLKLKNRLSMLDIESLPKILQTPELNDEEGDQQQSQQDILKKMNKLITDQSKIVDQTLKQLKNVGDGSVNLQEQYQNMMQRANEEFSQTSYQDYLAQENMNLQQNQGSFSSSNSIYNQSPHHYSYNNNEDFNFEQKHPIFEESNDHIINGLQEKDLNMEDMENNNRNQIMFQQQNLQRQQQQLQNINNYQENYDNGDHFHFNNVDNTIGYVQQQQQNQFSMNVQQQNISNLHSMNQQQQQFEYQQQQQILNTGLHINKLQAFNKEISQQQLQQQCNQQQLMHLPQSGKIKLDNNNTLEFDNMIPNNYY